MPDDPFLSGAYSTGKLHTNRSQAISRQRIQNTGLNRCFQFHPEHPNQSGTTCAAQKQQQRKRKKKDLLPPGPGDRSAPEPDKEGGGQAPAFPVKKRIPVFQKIKFLQLYIVRVLKLLESQFKIQFYIIKQIWVQH